jgi:hypothetical protein
MHITRDRSTRTISPVGVQVPARHTRHVRHVRL